MRLFTQAGASLEGVPSQSPGKALTKTRAVRTCEPAASRQGRHRTMQSISPQARQPYLISASQVAFIEAVSPFSSWTSMRRILPSALVKRARLQTLPAGLDTLDGVVRAEDQ